MVLRKAIMNIVPDVVAGILWNTIVCLDLIVYHIRVCYKNAKTLLKLLVSGTRTWVIMFARLMVFTALLMIGWMRLLQFYLFHPLILRNVEYGAGAKRRNLLDVYMPQPFNPFTSETKQQHQQSSQVEPRRPNDRMSARETERSNNQHNHHRRNNYSHGAKKNGDFTPEEHTQLLSPVIVFVSGGAWTIGYKLWSALIARGLSFAGFVVIVPDYRNFPQGDIGDMVTDVKRAMQWTVFNCGRFGGDPNRITLAGQSAGAHICLCLLVDEFFGNLPQENAQMPSEETTFGDKLTKLRSVSSEMEDLDTYQPTNGHPQQPFPDDVYEMKAKSEGNSVCTKQNRTGCGEELEDSEGEGEEHSCWGDIWRDVVPDAEKEAEKEGEKEGVAHLQRNLLSRSAGNGDTTVTLVAATPAQKLNQRQQQELQEEQEQQEQQQAAAVSARAHFRVTDSIQLFVGISGPYNLIALQDYLHRRGLDASILHWICRGAIATYSPTVRLQEYVESRLNNMNNNNTNRNNNSHMHNNHHHHNRNNKIMNKSGENSVEGMEIGVKHSTQPGAETLRNGRTGEMGDAEKKEQEREGEDQRMERGRERGSERGGIGSGGWSWWPSIGRSSAATPIPKYSASDPSTNIPQQATRAARREQPKEEEEEEQERAARNYAASELLSALPPIALIHGSLDKSIPLSISLELADLLMLYGGHVRAPKKNRALPRSLGETPVQRNPAHKIPAGERDITPSHSEKDGMELGDQQQQQQNNKHQQQQENEEEEEEEEEDSLMESKHTMFVYEGWSHTDAILEAPMMGNMRLVRDIQLLVAKTSEKQADLEVQSRNLLFEKSCAAAAVGTTVVKMRERGGEKERERQGERKRDSSLSHAVLSRDTSCLTDASHTLPLPRSLSLPLVVYEAQQPHRHYHKQQQQQQQQHLLPRRLQMQLPEDPLSPQHTPLFHTARTPVVDPSSLPRSPPPRLAVERSSCGGGGDEREKKAVNHTQTTTTISSSSSPASSLYFSPSEGGSVPLEGLHHTLSVSHPHGSTIDAAECVGEREGERELEREKSDATATAALDGGGGDGDVARAERVSSWRVRNYSTVVNDSLKKEQQSGRNVALDETMSSVLSGVQMLMSGTSGKHTIRDPISQETATTAAVVVDAARAEGNTLSGRCSVGSPKSRELRGKESMKTGGFPRNMSFLSLFSAVGGLIWRAVWVCLSMVWWILYRCFPFLSFSSYKKSVDARDTKADVVRDVRGRTVCSDFERKSSDDFSVHSAEWGRGDSLEPLAPRFLVAIAREINPF